MTFQLSAPSRAGEASTAPRRPRVLVTGDDGVSSAGMRALVKALAAAGICEVMAIAPAEQQSARSHAITLVPQLSGFNCCVPGAFEAFAVTDGTPADCVMLAMCAPVFSCGKAFDLVVSGINRGDNCGLHVLYSGTVGAAREAACRGVPAIAFSLANPLAHRLDDYAWAAHLAVCIIQTTLQQLQRSTAAAEHLELGCVLNVNIPAGPSTGWAGLALTHQGSGYMSLQYKEVSDAAAVQHVGAVADAGAGAGPSRRARVFKTSARAIHREDAPGTDNHAVKRQWVSVTPLWLKSDMPLSGDPALAAAADTTAVVADIIQAAAAASGLPVMGVERATSAAAAAAAAAATAVTAVAATAPLPPAPVAPAVAAAAAAAAKAAAATTAIATAVVAERVVHDLPALTASMVDAAMTCSGSDMSEDMSLDASSSSSAVPLTSCPLQLEGPLKMGHLLAPPPVVCST